MKKPIGRAGWRRGASQRPLLRFLWTLMLVAVGTGLPLASSAQVIANCQTPTLLTHGQVPVSATNQEGFGADMALSGDDLALAVGSRLEGGFGQDFETNLFLGGSSPWEDTNDHTFLGGPHLVAFSDQRLVVSDLFSLWTYTRFGNGIYPNEQLSSFGNEAFMDIKDVAIDGNFIIAGYGPDSLTWEGQVKIFQHDGTTWSEVASFAAPPGSLEQLGRSVDIAGNVAVAGAPGIGSSTPGRVREYLHIGGGNWVEGAVLTAESLFTEGDLFGWSVSLDGIRLAVGAPRLDVGFLPPLTPDVGGVYVFRRTFPFLVGEREAVLTGSGTGSRFGESVELIGDVLAVGAPGAGSGQAVIYQRQGSGWFLCHALARPANSSEFGFQVAMGSRGFLASSRFYVEDSTLFNRAVFYYPFGIFVDGFESGDTSSWSGPVP